MALASWVRNWKRSIEYRWQWQQSLRRKHVTRCRTVRPGLESLEDRWLLSTYVVTSTADDGSQGTLRDAINQANATGSTITEIDFNIGAVGSAQWINLTSQLPALTASGVFVNGLSQGGSSSSTQLITLNGTTAGSRSDGLLLQGTNCTVSGLIIEDFSKNGIEVAGSDNTIGGTAAGAGDIISANAGDGVLIDSTVSGVQVLGNSIGTNATGDVALANSDGIVIDGDSNIVGGTTPGALNLISGNINHGIQLNGNNNQVLGNYIGTNATGNTVLSNKIGIEIDGSSNTVGSSATGTGNLVSGNSSQGVLIGGSGNQVLGNSIGINAAGNAALANGMGIEIDSSDNTIGGTASGVGNLISGNGNGVLLSSGGDSNLLLGNSIGVNAAGNAALSNGYGIEIESTSNTIGGTDSGAGNIISGNGNGVILSSGGDSNLLLGNSIGINAAGNAALANGYGIQIHSNSNTIGGTSSGARNIVSGNSIEGVFISGSSNLVLGNYIGAKAAGNAALTNGYGIEIDGSSNTIGGTDSGAGNLISGNGTGVFLSSGGDSNQVLGNSIGITAAGTAALANSIGIMIDGSSNTIGGTSSGARNLISGNSSEGVYIGGSGNQVMGNYIGTNAAGNAALANKIGIVIDSNSNTVGGTASAAGNLISGNSSDGVLINGSGNRVFANSIGVNAAENAALANSIGIMIDGSNNTVGSTSSGAGNLISGNSSQGVFISGDNNQVLANSIGTNPAGNAALANSIGIELDGSSNTVGGTASAARNFISGNTDAGVLISGFGSSNKVMGNYIGTDVTGGLAVANSVGIELAASANTIGGTATGAGNVISGNSSDGVLLDSGSSGNQVLGNSIGTNASGVALGNGNYGVNISGVKNTIGGSVASAANIIADNTQGGVLVNSGSGNSIRLNSIYANGGNNSRSGITLNSGANNDLVAPNLISAQLSGNTLIVNGSFTAPTAKVSYVVDLYANLSGDAEGRVFLGSLTVTPTSTGTQAGAFPITTTVTGTYPLITATLTDASGNTSSFSTGVTVTNAPPVSPPPFNPTSLRLSPTPPILNMPPLLALINFFLGGIETINANGTETLTDSLFGMPLLVSTFDSSGQLMNVKFFGIDVTFLFG